MHSPVIWCGKMGIDEIHERAMELADEASLLKLRGQDGEAIALFRKAAELEMEAASLLPAAKESEPSRSILFRSAAFLAYDATDYKLADRLVASGLSGFPPDEIEKELKDLYDDVNFMRHAAAEGIEISEDGLVMTIAGPATFYGGALVDYVIDRLSRLQAEFYRTVERLLGIEFRINKPVDKKIRKSFNLYLDTQFASSFGVYLLVGERSGQLPLFPELEQVDDVDGRAVIREVIECLRILEGSEPEQLRERIKDETYYDDFVGFAKQIAPDGQQIKTVAFRSGATRDQRALILRKTRTQLKDSMPLTNGDGDGEATRFTLTGFLKRATSPKAGKFGTVGLDSRELGTRVTIKVPIGLMKDTVQPYFEESVAVSGYIRDGKYYLSDISELEELDG
jgi:hypothetical protein